MTGKTEMPASLITPLRTWARDHARKFTVQTHHTPPRQRLYHGGAIFYRQLTGMAGARAARPAIGQRSRGCGAAY